MSWNKSFKSLWKSVGEAECRAYGRECHCRWQWIRAEARRLEGDVPLEELHPTQKAWALDVAEGRPDLAWLAFRLAWAHAIAVARGIPLSP